MRYAAFPLLLILASTCVADDAYWSAVGGVENFGKSKDVRMVSEDVQITLHPAYMHVRATFNFKNDGRAKKVTTAFPELMVDYRQRKDNAPMSITHFKCWVDGQSVPVARKKVPLLNISEYAQVSAVWLKEVSFPAHGRRRVVCEYDSKCSLERQYVDAYYILRTGSTWKGPIGDCRIHVDWRHLVGMDDIRFLAASEPIGGGKSIRASREGGYWAEFHFRNLKPKFDLEMMWPSGFWNYVVNGRYPEQIPMRVDGQPQMHGTQSDPALDFDAFANLLGTRKEVERVDRMFAASNNLRAIKRVNLRGRKIDYVKDGLIKVDGKEVKVRPMKPKYSLNGVYVRDLVQALGGTFEYHPSTERAEIRIPVFRQQNRER